MAGAAVEEWQRAVDSYPIEADLQGGPDNIGEGDSKEAVMSVRGFLSVATLALLVCTASADPGEDTVVGAPNQPSAHDETPVGMTTGSELDGIENLEYLDIPSGWWKGNTHTHSSNSDGDSPPDAVAARYQSLGYDFLVLTDHNQLTPFSIYSSSGHLCVDGEEITHSTNHTNGLGLTSVIPAGSIQQNVDAVLGQGGVSHLNHPSYNYLTVDDIYPVVGLKHMEIHNALTDDWEEALWDALLTMGKPLYGVASDDCHALYSQSGHAWVVVRAPVLTRNEILAAMDTGDYYASTGIVLDDYSADDVAIVVDSQNGELIEFVGANGQVLHAVSDAYAEYLFTGSETYVRARITNVGNDYGWTQPHYPSWGLSGDAHADGVLGYGGLGVGSPLNVLGPLYEGKVPSNWSDFSVRLAAGAGIDAYLILDMGAGEAITDRDGFDLYVEEVDAEDGVGVADPYLVYVSDDAVTWAYIGDGLGDSYFDLGGVVSVARYVKIEVTELDAEIDGVEANVVDRHADWVVEYSGMSVGYPRYVVGAPYPYAIGDPWEDYACRIDPGGFLVLDLGAGEEQAVDGPGADIYVEEVDTEDGVSTDDSYTLSGSLDLVNWVVIGLGNGDAYFELGGLMSSVRYLRIEPVSASVEIDGVRVVNLASDSHIFSDGFESGNTSAWSSTVP